MAGRSNKTVIEGQGMSVGGCEESLASVPRQKSMCYSRRILWCQINHSQVGVSGVRGEVVDKQDLMSKTKVNNVNPSVHPHSSSVCPYVNLYQLLFLL